MNGKLRFVIAILALAVVAAVVPALGGSAATPGFSVNRTASLSRFKVPAQPIGYLENGLTSGQTGLVDLTGEHTFPENGDLLLGSKNGALELVAYDNSACGGAAAADQVCITERGKVGIGKAQVAGSEVKLATQLMEAVSATHVTCKLDAQILGSQTAPFKLRCAGTGNATAFGSSGAITIAHSTTQASNLLGGQASEFMEFDQVGGGCAALDAANELCITERAQQPNGIASIHRADGFPQPGPEPGGSTVHLHRQIRVKSNEGFFPTSFLAIFTIGAGNTFGADEEIVTYDNVATAIKDPTSTHNKACNDDMNPSDCDEFHITGRSADDSQAHPVDSIVTGADGQLVCRAGAVQPGVDIDSSTPGVQEPIGQTAGTSVGNYSVCYSTLQPNEVPKPTDSAGEVDVVGQILIILFALNQPFLSTGGFNSIYGPVPLVDADGVNDGVLKLTSPCIVAISPGINLKIDIEATQGVKSHTTPDTGTIRLILDAIPEGPGTTHNLCDDAAGTGNVTSTTYIYPGDPTTSDDDHDGDGCSDVEELNPSKILGGQRDPWNPHDFFDVGGSPGGNGAKDKIIDLANDIVRTIGAYGTSYAPADRHSLEYGPFFHNTAEGDGIVDLSNDIVGVIGQYANSCQAAP